jgi:hypothetical protein
MINQLCFPSSRLLGLTVEDALLVGNSLAACGGVLSGLFGVGTGCCMLSTLSIGAPGRGMASDKGERNCIQHPHIDVFSANCFESRVLCHLKKGMLIPLYVVYLLGGISS